MTSNNKKYKVSYNTKAVILKYIFKEIISINVFFLILWILPLSSRIAPANVTLPLGYLKKLLSPLPIPFYGHIYYTAKYIKMINKSRKTTKSFITWLYHISWIN